MKSKQIEQLREDFVKYCDQMGIVNRPRLVETRKEMHGIQVAAGDRKGCACWGECFWHLGIIFIDTGVQIHYPSRIYKGFTRPDRQRLKHKSRYTDFRRTLVHELVHWRFRKYRHGWRFERRVDDILRGMTFEPIQQQQIPLPPIQVQKKEYNGTLDYFV